MRVLVELARRAVEGRPLVLATVVRTEGSAPAKRAMKMLVDRTGRAAGSVGGGRVEAEVIHRAQAVLESGRPEIVSFTLDDDLADEGGMLCGGTVHILVERVEPPAAWAREAAALSGRGRRGVLLARIGPERVERTLLAGREAAPWLEDEEPRLVEEGALFVEPIVTPRCLILGAGHVGRAVARVAAEAGFDVQIVEDREAQARRARPLASRVVCSGLVEGFESLEPGPDDFVLVMTRTHGLDLACVRAALRSPARYVGLLASRKKAAAIGARLDEEGVERERLHAPVGLDLGAVSAGEIAVSVVAQMVKVRRMGRGDRISVADPRP